MSGWRLSQFGRTALLIAGALAVFSFIAWQAMVWTVIVPAAQVTVSALAERAQQALSAPPSAAVMPPDTRFASAAPPEVMRRFPGIAYRAYVTAIRDGLQVAVAPREVRVGRLAAPLELWVRVADDARGQWLVLSWRLGGPQAPLAALGVLAAGALIVLVGAAVSARLLTAPLAGLAAAAARLADGQSVDITTTAGPTEVRSLAVAFQSMSHRLAQLDEERELMLGGISHDLRTPLARLRVAVELLEHEDRALVEEMALSIEEMDRMIGQFLNYVRANYRESAAPASLDAVVLQALAAVGRALPVELALNAVESRCFAIECVRHTLQNLVQNALEYGAAPVTVSTSQTDEEIVLRVADRGAGLTEAQWWEAVKPFHRLRSQPGSGHAGLGLALVDRLVRVCGGRLRGELTPDGFEVTVRLPGLKTLVGGDS